MNDGIQNKQQIAEKIKESNSIMITVSSSPSVDGLAAALGLTILLNNMNKRATAIFSGSIPPAITFLDPEKTFENTVDSLRDFIIALDKEKADHLRYKVEGEVVKIFITPYKTTITGEDLEFSQGDYNVDLVLALGVTDKDNLDKALTAHGRILHDATVVTVNTGNEASDIGSIDWHESNASSLSEMMVGLAELLKQDKVSLDSQIATAFLTGIVSATARFSNSKTTSKVMTVASQLMAAGANQQLIASKFEESNKVLDNSDDQKNDKAKNKNPDGTTDLSEGKSSKVNKKDNEKPSRVVEKPASNDNDGSLLVSHEKAGSIDEVAVETAEENQDLALDLVEEKLEKDRQEQMVKQQSEATKKAQEVLKSQNATQPPAPLFPQPPAVKDPTELVGHNNNSTYVENNLAGNQAPFNSTAVPSNEEPVSIDPFRDQKEAHIDARNAVSAAFDKPDFEPAPFPTNQSNVEPPVQPKDNTPIVKPLPSVELPPLPDFSTLPPLPPVPDFSAPASSVMPEKLGDIFSSPPPQLVPSKPASKDSSQFNIPGQ